MCFKDVFRDHTKAQSIGINAAVLDLALLINTLTGRHKRPNSKTHGIQGHLSNRYTNFEHICEQVYEAIWVDQTMTMKSKEIPWGMSGAGSIRVHSMKALN